MGICVPCGMCVTCVTPPPPPGKVSDIEISYEPFGASAHDFRSRGPAAKLGLIGGFSSCRRCVSALCQSFALPRKRAPNPNAAASLEAAPEKGM